MSTPIRLRNNVRERRTLMGLSQEDLARRAGLSRSGVSAIEMGHLVPSAVAVLSLASVLGCRVEDLFSLEGDSKPEISWCGQPGDPCRYWRAQVRDRVVHYPVEPTGAGYRLHDGVFKHGSLQKACMDDPAKTLVITTCDPAVGILAEYFHRQTPFRLIALTRSSREGLGLLAQGMVHAAGIHLARSGDEASNEAAAKAVLPAARMLHVADWDEGAAVSPHLQLKSLAALSHARVRWIGRDRDSGAGQCMTEIMKDRPWPRHLAHDHRGVADAIKSGWADVGVCVRLAGEEAGLDFVQIRTEAYDLCFDSASTQDPRVQALIAVVRSSDYRAHISELPGYFAKHSGEVRG